MQTATVATFPHTTSTPVPRPPATIEETGLSADQISRLFMKTLYAGEASGVAIED